MDRIKAIPRRPRWRVTPRFAEAFRQTAGLLTKAELRRALRECELMTSGNVDWLVGALRELIANECRVEIARRDRRRKSPLLFPLK